MRKTIPVWLLLGITLFAGCSSVERRAPLHTEPYVDLERFMGDWYVIANIPTSIEKEAYNAVESYALNEDGTIATTFTFRKGGFDGKEKRYTPTGFVRDAETNAVWGMQFIRPFKADYRIMYVDSHYGTTIVGREKRDHVWIMARRPTIPVSDYRMLLTFLEHEGYDISKIRKVPQRWDRPVS